MAQSAQNTVSLIIPSRGRSLKLQNLIDSIAVQAVPAGWRVETVVIIDGEGDQPRPPPGVDLSIHTIEHSGAAAARNEGIDNSAGEVLIFLNNDVVLMPGCIAAHIAAIRDGHRAAVGHSPWKTPADPRLFDAFIAHTPAIFAQPSLVPHALHDFRSAWTLNLSVARSVIDGVLHPFTPGLRPVYYEDLEFAHRCLGGAPAIKHEPGAIVVHDHRVSIGDYFRREVLLGMMSVVLGETNPACFDALFPVDPESHAGAARPILGLDEPDHRRLLALFIQRGARRIQSVDDSQDEASGLFVSHLPLKRRAFRLGLLAQLDRAVPWDERLGEAARVVRMDPVFGGLPDHPLLASEGRTENARCDPHRAFKAGDQI